MKTSSQRERIQYFQVPRRGTDEDRLAKWLEIKIEGDGIMLEVRESR